MALTLVLLCGLFLLGVSEGRPRWKELLLIFAAAELTVYPLAVGFGTYFFPAALLGVLAWRGCACWRWRRIWRCTARAGSGWRGR